MKKRISLGVLVTTILVLGLVGAVVYYNLGFRQRADVLPEAIITVYTNEALTEELTQGEYLDWGPISSGTNLMDLWINNTGLVDALIRFDYDHQQLPGDWTETWDYNDVPIAPNEVRKVTINFTLAQDIGAGHYEWNSWINAWAAPLP